MIALDVDFKYLFTNISILMDSVCLFLVFKKQTYIYKSTCGCLCDTCCIECIHRSRYEAIQESEQESDAV